MNKGKTFYNFCKVSVDDAELVNGEYVCYCITNGTPDELEPAALRLIVPMHELRYQVAGTKGMVEVECTSDPAETDKIPFNTWLDLQTTKDLFPHLEAVINTNRYFEYAAPPVDMSIIECLESCGFEVAFAEKDHIRYIHGNHTVLLNLERNSVAGFISETQLAFTINVPITDTVLFGVLVSLDFVAPKEPKKAA